MCDSIKIACHDERLAIEVKGQNRAIYGHLAKHFKLLVESSSIGTVISYMLNGENLFSIMSGFLNLGNDYKA